MIFISGEWRYWSVSPDYKYNRFTTTEYNRRALCQELRLSRQDMPLFSTLCGNDIIDYDDVEKFHESLGNYRRNFYNIALFLKQMKKLDNFNENYFIELANRIIPHKNPVETVELIKKSLKLYNLKLIEESRNTTDPILKIALNVNASVYEILLDLPTSLSIGLFDIRQVFCIIFIF